jgi:hypothetical protein
MFQVFISHASCEKIIFDADACERKMNFHFHDPMRTYSHLKCDNLGKKRLSIFRKFIYRLHMKLPSNGKVIKLKKKKGRNMNLYPGFFSILDVHDN